MNLTKLSEHFSGLAIINDLISGKKKDIRCIPGAATALLISAISSKVNKPVLVLSQNAPALAEDIRAFAGNRSVHFPSWDTFPAEDISPTKEVIGDRLNTLCRLLDGEKLVVTANIRAASSWCMPRKILQNNSIELSKGSKLFPREKLIVGLVRLGYKRRDIVGEKGEFSVRGSIVDIFTAHLSDPIRVEFVGDTIESIRNFDTAAQRSVRYLEKAVILPLHELIIEDEEYVDGIELRIPSIYKDFSSILDYFETAYVIFDDTSLINMNHDRYVSEVESLRRGVEGKFYLTVQEVGALASKTHKINIESSDDNEFGLRPADEFFGKLDDMDDWLMKSSQKQTKLIISKQADMIYDLLFEKGRLPLKVEQAPAPGTGGIYILYGDVSKGLYSNDLVLFTDREIFSSPKARSPVKYKAKEGISDDLLAKLALNDIVVHSNYGIGIYRGLKKLEIGDALQEYIHIDYADEDTLYVPLHQMGNVEKYVSGSDHIPKLDKLGGKQWLIRKTKAKKAIKDLTKDLIELYSERGRQTGFRYPADSIWQLELERSFPYEETLDQEKAIRDIKKEMESGKLIDRLVCGDVGYGKTEVAIRAAFKTVQAGKQVAILAPTTILADQHFHTLSERFKPYPVVLGLLSRFRSKEEQGQVIKDLEAGAVDVVVGTHRLLSKDIKFKDLGMLIIDEEHKFGVEHKEILKKMSTGANIVTLSATPIPRTLYMSLSGIREMSVISTPPLDRSPVRTYLRPWDETVIKEAVLRELDRGGQVYFVHNHVKTIHKIAARIQELVPQARVSVAHGQMKEHELEDVMVNFIDKECDILVSTSIIESGLDIPTVNTVIIDHAENFGLAQLYQIRGRVGRSSTRAFAYLLYHKEQVLTQTAIDRLNAIKDFTALGSGYRLAMADLEIRGAGTLLGASQHGHMLHIGFDMYSDLMEESVRELKHIETPASRKVLIDLKVDAFIPADYVEDEKQRIALYRRMNFFDTLDQLNEFKSELVDRFGKVPSELETLHKIIRIKIKAADKGIISILGGPSLITIKFIKKPTITISPKSGTADASLKYIEDSISRMPSLN